MEWFQIKLHKIKLIHITMQIHILAMLQECMELTCITLNSLDHYWHHILFGLASDADKDVQDSHESWDLFWIYLHVLRQVKHKYNR